MRKTIYIPAEVEIDDNSILEQMKHVKKEMWALDSELSKLGDLLRSARTKGKGDSEESPRN